MHLVRDGSDFVVGITPIPNTTSIGPMVDSWNKNMHLVRDGSDFKIHIEKPNYKHVKAKIDSTKRPFNLDRVEKKILGG
jgi:hypothetical protein